MSAPARPDSERGSAAVELVLVTPLLIVMLLFVAFGGRMVMARGDIDAAARDAARAASLARSPAAADQAARDAADASLAARQAPCADLDVRTDTSGFRPGGTVAVTVTCHLSLGDLALLAVPASRALTGHAVAPVDAYRGIR